MSTHSASVSGVSTPSAQRVLWLVLGFVNIGLAVVGALLPVMPSTVLAKGNPTVSIIVAAILIASAWYVLSRPTPPRATSP